MKYVCLTFDDGLISHLKIAAPMLNKYGFKGTFFISGQLVDLRQNCYVDWDQVKQIDEMGHEIGNHFYFHIDYSVNTTRYASISIQTMEERFAAKKVTRPSSMSYPGFHVSDCLKGVVKDHGYTFARSGLEKILEFNDYQAGGSGITYKERDDPYQIQCLGLFGKKYGIKEFDKDLSKIGHNQTGVFCFHDIYQRVSDRPLIKDPEVDTDITMSEFEACLKLLYQKKEYQVVLMKDIGHRIKHL